MVLTAEHFLWKSERYLTKEIHSVKELRMLTFISFEAFCLKAETWNQTVIDVGVI